MEVITQGWSFDDKARTFSIVERLFALIAQLAKLRRRRDRKLNKRNEP